MRWQAAGAIALLAATSCQPATDRVSAAIAAGYSPDEGGMVDLTGVLPPFAKRVDEELKAAGYERVAVRKPPPVGAVVPLSLSESFPELPPVDGAVRRLHFTRAVSQRDAIIQYGVAVDVGADDWVLRVTGFVLSTIMNW